MLIKNLMISKYEMLDLNRSELIDYDTQMNHLRSSNLEQGLD